MNSKNTSDAKRPRMSWMGHKKADVEMFWIIIALVFVILGVVLALIISGKIANLGNAIIEGFG